MRDPSRENSDLMSLRICTGNYVRVWFRYSYKYRDLLLINPSKTYSINYNKMGHKYYGPNFPLKCLHRHTSMQEL